jgi:hypothetical protein
MRIDDLEEHEENPPAECSSCRGKVFGSYLYGLIYPEEELLAQIERGEVRLRGCLIEFDDPQWFCRNCGTDYL